MAESRFTTNCGEVDGTLEPKKEVKNFTWTIKVFLALWGRATRTLTNNIIKYNLIIGRTPVKIHFRLFVPNENEITNINNVDSGTIALYFGQQGQWPRETFVKYNVHVLRSDGTCFKYIEVENPMDFQNILKISELENKENKLLEDGTLQLHFQVTFYNNQPRESMKRSYDSIELQQQSYQCLSDSFESMRKKQKYSDAVLITNDGKKLKVHKMILSARSSVFETMFDTNTSGEYKIADLCFEALEIFVDFIYTGKFNEDWIKYVPEVVNAAEKYDLPLIKEMGDNDLIKTVTPQNAFKMLEFAKVHQLKKAVEEIKEYIRMNIDTILKSF